MKIKTVLIFILCAAFSACTINVNEPNANANSAGNITKTSTEKTDNKTHWSVVVCSSRAKILTLSAGPNEADSEVFATYTENSAQKKFDLPARVQNLSAVYFMGSASDKKQIELCVLYDGKPKKRVEFDDSEDHLIKSSDTDDNDCRCTE